MSSSLPNPPGGLSPFSQWAERLTDAIRRKQIIPGANYGLQESAKGTLLVLRQQGGGGTEAASTIHSFIFTQAFQNYVIATDQQTGSATQIAKPYKLRQVGRALEIINGEVWRLVYNNGGPANQCRTKSLDNGYFEYQRISPPFLPQTTVGSDFMPGDVIYAVQLTFASASSEAGDPVTPVTGTAITWVDLNLDGRAWAANADPTQP